MEITPQIATRLVGFIEKCSSVLAEQAAALAAAQTVQTTKSAASLEKPVKAVVATLVKQGLCDPTRAEAKEQAYLAEGGALLLLSDLQKAANLVTTQSIGAPAGAGASPSGALDETELSADDAYAQHLMGGSQQRQ